MKKDQLKILIKEVLQEIEGMVREVEPSTPDPKDNPSDSPEGPVEDPSPNAMKHSRERQQKSGEAEIKLTLRGLKPGKAYKKVMAALAHQAMMADLEVIHAEIESGGKTLDSMDITQLKQELPSEKSKPKSNLPQINLQNLEQDQQAQWNDPNLPADERKRLYRLSKIAPGERAGEWEKATADDVQGARDKAKLKAAKIAAGTYDPQDTSLWTDKEWDAYNQDQDDVQTYGAETGLKSAGKYKPGLSKKTGKAMPKVHIGTLRNQ